MRRFKTYGDMILIVTCALVFLGLNTVYDDVIGFKAFITQEERLEDSRLILSSRFIPIKEGNKAIVSKPLHHFEGRVISENSKIYLEDGLISMPVDNERLYRVFADAKLVYLGSSLGGVILLRSLYDKYKEKKIKGIK